MCHFSQSLASCFQSSLKQEFLKILLNCQKLDDKMDLTHLCPLYCLFNYSCWAYLGTKAGNGSKQRMRKYSLPARISNVLYWKMGIYLLVQRKDFRGRRKFTIVRKNVYTTVEIWVTVLRVRGSFIMQRTIRGEEGIEIGGMKEMWKCVMWKVSGCALLFDPLPLFYLANSHCDVVSQTQTDF